MKIAVGIPVRNARPEFEKMMESLMKFTKNFSLFICDDASGAYTRNYINTLPAKRIIRHKKQQWFTRSANNVLIASYLDGADFIFLLNSDIVLCKNWVERMIKPFKNKKVALVGSSYVHSRAGAPIIVKPPAFVTGHCWCLRAEYLPRIGILDETHIHIESDKEFCYRLFNKGFLPLLDRALPIKHVNGASWRHNMTILSKYSSSHLLKKRRIGCLSDPGYVKMMRKRLKLDAGNTRS